MRTLAGRHAGQCPSLRAHYRWLYGSRMTEGCRAKFLVPREAMRVLHAYARRRRCLPPSPETTPSGMLCRRHASPPVKLAKRPNRRPFDETGKKGGKDQHGGNGDEQRADIGPPDLMQVAKSEIADVAVADIKRIGDG